MRVIRARFFSAGRACVAAILSVMANWPVLAAELLPQGFHSVAERHQVPVDVLYALAKQESGRYQGGEHKPWPWTLNVAGQGYYFDSYAQACTALQQALQETSLVDVGIAQLNVRWNPGLFGPAGRFSDPCAGLDPYNNLDAAAAILRAHFDEAGNWLTAVGRYHRPAGGDAAQRYARAVATRLSGAAHADFQQAFSRHSTDSSSKPKPTLPSIVWVAPTATVWISPVSSGG